MRFHLSLNRVSAFAVPIVSIGMMPLAGAAMAQSSTAAAISSTAAAIYQSSHRIKTNVPGVTGFPDLPAGFDAVNASAEQRAAYGLPPAPNQAADPASYAKWMKAMSMVAHATHYAGPLTVTNRKSMPMKAAGKPAGSAEGTISVGSFNWSGVANLVPNLTSWNASNSFLFVVSEFNVPVAQEAFGFCDGTTDLEVSWNGIDGYDNGDVLQGGTLSQASCVNYGGLPVTSTQYFAWIEWYPSYPILGAYYVGPGDDMFVETYAPSATQGYVYVYDLTRAIYGAYSIAPTGSTRLVGDSAEYIVERPCCNGSNYYALVNYVGDFWASNYAYTGAGVLRYPGQTGSNTSLLTMYADNGTTPISYTPEIGPPYQIWFNDVNCAYSGGCTP
ncbi:MAG: G1 family glutamic endopeptidase [Methylocella sp.]